MDSSNLPVACNLTAPELQRRREEVLLQAKSAVTDITELEDGFSYRFPSAKTWLNDVAELVSLEHECCPFMKFRITVEPGDGALLLEMTGPPGTKEFLAEVFG